MIISLERPNINSSKTTKSAPVQKPVRFSAKDDLFATLPEVFRNKIYTIGDAFKNELDAHKIKGGFMWGIDPKNINEIVLWVAVSDESAKKRLIRVFLKKGIIQPVHGQSNQYQFQGNTNIRFTLLT